PALSRGSLSLMTSRNANVLATSSEPEPAARRRSTRRRPMSEEVHGVESGNSPPPKGGRLTNEQRAAQQHLQSLGRYRIKTGSDGWPFIPGEYGRVEWDCGYSVFTASRRMIPKLMAVPGVTRYQLGDSEANLLLRPDAIKPVLALI